MILEILTCLLSLVAPLMVTLETFGGYQFSAWDYVFPVAVSTAFLVFVMVRAHEQDLKDGAGNG